LRASLADDPTSAELHATLAAVLFRRGDRAGSVAHYLEALRLNPGLTVVSQELAALEHSTTAPTPTTSPAP
jgi:cytochrome c-type biogenesis protein CcmH/NrfG